MQWLSSQLGQPHPTLEHHLGLSGLQLSANAHQWEAAGDGSTVIRSSPPMWDTQIEFLTLGFGLAQPQLFQALRSDSVKVIRKEK